MIRMTQKRRTEYMQGLEYQIDSLKKSLKTLKPSDDVYKHRVGAISGLKLALGNFRRMTMPIELGLCDDDTCQV